MVNELSYKQKSLQSYDRKLFPQRFLFPLAQVFNSDVSELYRRSMTKETNMATISL